MPSHQERREPLPKGYQFGDGRLSLTMAFYLYEKIAEIERIAQIKDPALRPSVSLEELRFIR